MEGSPKQKTDDSSIKPVSSLRAQFESMNTSKPARATTVFSTIPQSHQPPKKEIQDTSGSRSMNAHGRLSFEPAHQVTTLPLAAASSHQQLPDLAKQPTITHETPRQRPVSMRVLPSSSRSPTRITPIVNISSPKSPPKSSDLATPTNARQSRHAHSSSVKSDNLGISPPLNFRFPERTSLPYSDRPRTPSLTAPEPPPPRRSHASPHGSNSTSGRASPNPLPVVNRASKPKYNDEAVAVATNRASPFSTPPSSGEASPEPDVPPPLPSHARPTHKQQPALSLTTTSVQPMTPVTPRGLPQTHSSYSTGSRKIPAHNLASKQDTPIQDDLPSSRPTLPPRREPSPRIDHAPRIPRRSTDMPPRPSALTQGFASSLSVGASKDGQSDHHFSRSISTLPYSNAYNNRPRSPPLGITRHESFPYHVESKQTQSLEPLHPEEQTLPLSEYPDISQANRRPPFFIDGPRMIPTNYDTRLFDVCGDFACVTGLVTRVWNILTGKLLLSMTHGDLIKITALAFKPNRNIDEEGTRLWLGNNVGEIQELDVLSKRVVAVNSSAHNRREITRIHRHAADVWTLDNEGKLYVWPPDASGASNLAHGIPNPRVQRSRGTSIVVGDQLWVTTGKDVRVYQPSKDANESSFYVTTRVLTRSDAGDITSSATISSEADHVYFGHSDGKVSVYSIRQLALTGLYNISLYKINCLAGVRGHLWAGFNTGKLFVYDTRSKPWRVVKDWVAHDNPVHGLIVDRSSIWKLDRLQIISLGLDNVLGVWDGLLRDDWLGTMLLWPFLGLPNADTQQAHQMEAKEAEYCRFQEITNLIFSWNAGASKPGDFRADERNSKFFQKLIVMQEMPDIVVFGLQELVDLEDKRLTAKTFFKSSKHKEAGHDNLSSAYRAWRDYLTVCLDDASPHQDPYVLLHTASLVGLFTCVFVKSSVRPRIRDVQAGEVKCGMGGIYGNKGAIIVRLILDDSSLCFVNCHLAAGQTQTISRNNDVAAILDSASLPVARPITLQAEAFGTGGDGSMIMDHEICVLNGDLNYRIEGMGRDTVVNEIRMKGLAKLLERDQLLMTRRRNPEFSLRAFTEAPITFEPTYKYDVGTNNYDSSEKKRAPAWCDRVLYRAAPGKVVQLEYRRHEVHISDHRPVSAKLRLKVKTIHHERRAQCRERCMDDLREAKQQASTDARLDYLTEVFGLSAQEGQRLLMDTAT